MDDCDAHPYSATSSVSFLFAFDLSWTRITGHCIGLSLIDRAAKVPSLPLVSKESCTHASLKAFLKIFVDFLPLMKLWNARASGLSESAPLAEPSATNTHQPVIGAAGRGTASRCLWLPILNLRLPHKLFNLRVHEVS